MAGACARAAVASVWTSSGLIPAAPAPASPGTCASMYLDPFVPVEHPCSSRQRKISQASVPRRI
eukprot:11394813-Alexandrium_andersonii.AAC.1